MKYYLTFALFIIMSLNVHAQINMADSSFQAISYWDKGEAHSYKISQNKYKVIGKDTTVAEAYSYSVDISVLDSTAHEYTVEWFYHDYALETENEIMEKLFELNTDMKVVIKTDEMGMVKEVVNWKEVSEYINKSMKQLKKDLAHIPNINKIIKQASNMYSSKESIEKGAINEIIQFHSFHGGKYQFNKEVHADTQVANMLGGEPFDANINVWLDNIYPDDYIVDLKLHQKVNSIQLTKVTYDYLCELAKMMKQPEPKWDDFPTVKNETYLYSQIHDSGWPLYSIETKEVSSQNTLQIEERIIDFIK
ncbi:hypothetical protein [Aureibacter tunicatorum]|uniref:Uncharacterized protein n=1 Tax=Aureibacter tunicatorum TaxID=866807 RepID=A0AAE4BQ86_9BACT|nr:hypothetical protein [Aureibacter tunicatorum]MDR6238839.1 hypothetical protein [Aureibacter tunicatorum]BDD05234.1 hypothetical protein AUTU_27170 [Aureibacter tunicatorum]